MKTPSSPNSSDTPLDPGERAVRFINKLTLTEDYQGEPFRLRPWQEKPIREIFGTLRPDGTRRYRRGLFFFPRGQAKTQLAGGIGCYWLHGTGRYGQEGIGAAGSKKQASHLFKKMCQMIDAQPWLRKRSRIYKTDLKIETRKGNTFEVVSADGDLQHGGNPSLVIFDELHVQKNRNLYDALTSSFGKRRDPLFLAITTAGNNRRSLCYDEYMHAKRVLADPSVDPSYYPLIYEAPEGADWKDEATWAAAMPALGDFTTLDFIRSEFGRAIESPSEQSKFCQLYLNMWVASAQKWLNHERWAACGVDRYTADDLVGRACYGGLDLSSTKDVTAFVLVFPNDDGTYRLLCWFWIPREVAEEADLSRHTRYTEWAKQGFITLTEGNAIDHEVIYTKIEEICLRYCVQEIRVDPLGAQQTARHLVNHGLNVQFMRQGFYSMNEPVVTLEIDLARGRIQHGGNPVLEWMAGNAVTLRDAEGLVRFSKNNSADKIDGMVALAMARAASYQTPIITPGIDYLDG